MAVIYTIDSSDVWLSIVPISVLEVDRADVEFIVSTITLEEFAMELFPLISIEEFKFVRVLTFDVLGFAVVAQVDTVDRNTSVSDCLR